MLSFKYATDGTSINWVTCFESLRGSLHDGNMIDFNLLHSVCNNLRLLARAKVTGLRRSFRLRHYERI